MSVHENRPRGRVAGTRTSPRRGPQTHIVNVGKDLTGQRTPHTGSTVFPRSGEPSQLRSRVADGNPWDGKPCHTEPKEMEGEGRVPLTGYLGSRGRSNGDTLLGGGEGPYSTVLWVLTLFLVRRPIFSLHRRSRFVPSHHTPVSGSPSDRYVDARTGSSVHHRPRGIDVHTKPLRSP